MKTGPHSELGVLAQGLVEDLERVRPSWPAETSLEEVRRAARRRAHVRLQELYRELHQIGAQSPMPAELELYRREVDDILLPRYCTLAVRQNSAEREYAGVFNRVLYSLFFCLTGFMIVCWTSLPGALRWMPLLLGALAPWFSVLLPDLHARYVGCPHKAHLALLLRDMDQAGLTLPTEADQVLPAHPTLLQLAAGDAGPRLT